MTRRRRSSSSYSSGSRSADRIMTRAHSAHCRCVALAPCCPHALPPSPIGTSGDAAGALQPREVRQAKWKRERRPRPAGNRAAPQGGDLSQVSPRLRAAGGLGVGLGVGTGAGARAGTGTVGLGRDWDWPRMPRARVDLWLCDVRLRWRWGGWARRIGGYG